MVIITIYTIILTEIIFFDNTFSLVEAIKFGMNASELKLDEQLKIPTNISIIPESIEKGNLYLSAIISDNKVNFVRDLDDELFPFQLDRWYQLVEFVPNYSSDIQRHNITIDNLIIGQMRDFDGFDELLNNTKIYKNVPTNSTVMFDIPNKDISYMEAEIKVPSGESVIYYGLYDGNQQSNKSKINLYVNPESSLRIMKPNDATEIRENVLLYNATFTMVCNDLYKLGYKKCQTNMIKE